MENPRPEGTGLAFPVGAYITPVAIDIQSAPPVGPPSTAFAGVGRDFPARMWRAPQAPSIAEWESVQEWPWSGPRNLVPMRIPIAPHQGHLPFPERVTVQMPEQTTVGAQSAVIGGVNLPVGDASYLKLLGM